MVNDMVMNVDIAIYDVSQNQAVFWSKSCEFIWGYLIISDTHQIIWVDTMKESKHSCILTHFHWNKLAAKEFEKPSLTLFIWINIPCLYLASAFKITCSGFGNIFAFLIECKNSPAYQYNIYIYIYTSNIYIYIWHIYIYDIYIYIYIYDMNKGLDMSNINIAWW